jgi:hypothetical protein
MTKTVRSVAGQLHHLPWVLAGIVLAAGLANWALFGRQPAQAAAEPEPEKPAAVMIDENAFREVVMPESQGGWQASSTSNKNLPTGGHDGNVEPFLKVEVEGQPFPVAQD